MKVLDRPWGRMHFLSDGGEGPTLVLANSLGTDLRIWDALLPRLPSGLRVLRFDKRGHGLSDLAGETSIEDLAADVAALIEAAAPGERVAFCGVSIGGLIGQALAVARPNVLAALVLSNTATRVGTEESWAARIAQVEEQGLSAIADGIMERWFAGPFRSTPEISLWRNMLLRTPAEGYVACCQALARADLTQAAGRIGLPVLMVGGSRDEATPPELVRDAARRIPGARLALIEDAGHLPMVEAPDAFAAVVLPFLREHLHV